MATVLDPTTETPLPDRYEVVNGEVVEKPPMSWLACEVANRLNLELGIYGRTSGRGRPRMDMMFGLPTRRDPGRKREPDLSFTDFARWPADRPLPYEGDVVGVVPNLMVEVASPDNDPDALVGKAREYLRAGAELVWLVYPRAREVHAYAPGGAANRVFTAADILDAGDVLPGFSVPMAGLFPPVIDQPGPDDEDHGDDA
ncbi:MAG: Uma2 family endonuclease [Gemmataceae bacterium]|nr:Uma2 family endonuclease [Gemmataceae bacterium]